MSTLPPYAQFPGSFIFNPPCRMINANMYGFFIEGDLDTIQKFIDDTINTVWSEDFTFKALFSSCMLTFTDIESIQPTSKPYVDQGWFQETDIIIWVPVAKVVDDKIDYIYLYPAFICVNNIYALINGRETWGFNK